MSMTLIETVELASSASSITFSSIPQTYTDLKILCASRGDTTLGNIWEDINLNLNGTIGSAILLFGTGSVADSISPPDISGGFGNQAEATSNTFGNQAIYIPNYKSTTTKSYTIDSIVENNATTAFTAILAGTNSTTSAVATIALVPRFGNFVAGSTFSLYGITAGSDGTTTVS